MDSLEKIAREPITGNTSIWTPDLDIVLPVRVPEHKQWIKCKEFSLCHPGYDFREYYDAKGNHFSELPSEAEITAVGPGIVKDIISYQNNNWIKIEYGRPGSGLFAHYLFAQPKVEVGQQVNKGDCIALVEQSPDYGKTVRKLHFGFYNMLNGVLTPVDPSIIFPEIAHKQLMK